MKVNYLDAVKLPVSAWNMIPLEKSTLIPPTSENWQTRQACPWFEGLSVKIGYWNNL